MPGQRTAPRRVQRRVGQPGYTRALRRSKEQGNRMFSACRLSSEKFNSEVDATDLKRVRGERRACAFKWRPSKNKVSICGV